MGLPDKAQAVFDKAVELDKKIVGFIIGAILL